MIEWRRLTETDGVLTRHLLPPILPTGYIKALDSSISMLCSARASLAHDNAGDFETPNLEFELWDCRTGLPTPPRERPGPGYGRFRPLELYDLLFSNAALHWILRPVDGNGGGGGVTERFFTCANRLLVEGGKMVFEMGGRGNVAEFRAALLMATARRIGIERARMADPWFFPSGSWMRTQLTKFGFEVEKMEMEYRPTPAEKGPNGGIEGWVRLMGKAFLEAVEENEREGVVKEVCEALKTVVGEEGEETLGYVRLRVKARKVWCV